MSQARDERLFVGRQRELSELDRAFRNGTGGRGELILLAGEPGIGKSALAEHAAGRAAEQDFVVAWGACWESGDHAPYWPWVQILRSLAQDHAPRVLKGALGGAAAALREILPALADTVSTAAQPASAMGGRRSRLELFEAIVTFLRLASSSRPVLVILEDLHWADQSSVRVLQFLALELRTSRIVVLGTYRPIDLHEHRATAAAISSLSRSARRLPLTGLTEDEVGRFAEGAGFETVPQGVVRRICSDTSGNPLLVDELLRNLRADGGTRSLADALDSLPLANGVRGVVRDRLTPLSAEGRDALEWASVIGVDFDVALLASALGTSPAAALERLDGAMSRAILAPAPDAVGRYRFSHALVRDAIYHDLAETRRLTMHGRVATAITALHRDRLADQLGEIAHHRLKAAASGAPTEVADAVDALVDAARRATALHAHEDAAAQYERALYLIDRGGPRDPHREFTSALECGQAHNRVGRTTEAAARVQRAAELARRTGDADGLARAALALSEVGLGLTWVEYGRVDRASIALLEEVLAQLPQEDRALRARVLARLATEVFWTHGERSRDLSAEALRLARESGDRALLAFVLLARAIALAGPDDLDAHEAVTAEILELTSETDRRELGLAAWMWRLGDALQLGDLAAADQAIRALLDLVEELRQPTDRWLIPASQSVRALLEGRFDEAENLAVRVGSEETLIDNAEKLSTALLFLVRRERGSVSEMIEGLQVVAAETGAPRPWLAGLALLYAENGRVAEAQRELDRLAENELADVPRDLNWIFTLAVLAEVAAVCDDRDRARLVYDLLRGYSERNVVVGVFFYHGPVSYYVALAAAHSGRTDEAATHFANALERAERLGARPFHARILCEYGHLLARGAPSGAPEAARMLERAAEMASSLGMAPVEARARSGLALLERTDRDEEAGAIVTRFHPDGDFWTLQFRGRTSRLKNRKGFHHLRRLLANPGTEIHVLDLAASGGVAGMAASPAESTVVRGLGDSGPRIDEKARRAYRERRRELQSDIDEAEELRDLGRAERARAEFEAIDDELRSALGAGGRVRRADDVSERARASVSKAIRAALHAIEEAEPELATNLRKAVRTGTFCAYEPSGGFTIATEPA